MKKEQEQERSSQNQNESTQELSARILSLCFAALLIPGLGHAILRKWDRAIVFFGCILFMFLTGLYLEGELFRPELDITFSTLKFIADAGSGLFYWISWLSDIGTPNPTAYTYGYANVFLYVAGLLNMLVVIDVFDIAKGRKP